MVNKLILSILISFTSLSLMAADVLYIGDSHSVVEERNPQSGMRLGNYLLDYIENSGLTVSYNAVCGSSPVSWEGKPNICGTTTYNTDGTLKHGKHNADSFKDLLDKTSPKTVMINLGDNMFSVKNNVLTVPTSKQGQNQIIKQIQDMINKIPSDKECILIGPTYHSPGKPYRKDNFEVDTMYVVLNKALSGKCKLIDNRSVFSTKAGNKASASGDGLHHSNRTDENGDSDVKRLATNIIHELDNVWTLKKPKSKGRPIKIKIMKPSDAEGTN